MFAASDYIDHVCAILAGPEHKVDLACGRIVSPNRLGAFDRKPYFAVHIIKAVRPAQRTQINGWLCRHRREVSNSEGMQGATAIVRNVCRPSVAGGNYLVRIVAHRCSSHNFEGAWIHQAERVVALGKHQQMPLLGSCWC